MNLSMYATLFKLAPFGKKPIIEALRKTAHDLKKSKSRKDWDEATISLVAAGFFSMEIKEWKIAASIAYELEQWAIHYEENNGTQSQRMRAHGNSLLLKSAVRIFQHNKPDLKKNYDFIQSQLSQAVVESAFYGKRWKSAQIIAAQLQLYLSWLILGEDHEQTWNTVKSLTQGLYPEEAIQSLDSGWFLEALPDWKEFVKDVKEITQNGDNYLIEKINFLKSKK